MASDLHPFKLVFQHSLPSGSGSLLLLPTRSQCLQQLELHSSLVRSFILVAVSTATCSLHLLSSLKLPSGCCSSPSGGWAVHGKQHYTPAVLVHTVLNNGNVLCAFKPFSHQCYEIDQREWKNKYIFVYRWLFVLSLRYRLVSAVVLFQVSAGLPSSSSPLVAAILSTTL